MIECIFRDIEAIYDFVENDRIGWFYLVAKWMMVGRTLVLIAIFELMSRESIRKSLIAIWAALSALLIGMDTVWMILSEYYGYTMDTMAIISVDKPGDWAYFLLNIMILFGVYVAYQIYHNAAPSLKIHARWFFVGYLIGGIALVLFESDRILSVTLSRYISGVFLGVGILIITVVLFIRPQLAYVLPFQVLRLCVMDIGSGLALYSHTWEAGKNFVDEDLFSGMLQGIRSIIQESMQQGDLKEIKTESATILLHKRTDTPLLFLLVTTVSSNILRNTLNLFADEFIQQFANSMNFLPNIEPFKQAIDIIQEVFTFT
jgi:hypothetical protein